MRTPPKHPLLRWLWMHLAPYEWRVRHLPINERYAHKFRLTERENRIFWGLD